MIKKIFQRENRLILIFFVVVVAALVTVVVLRLVTPEDTWVCQNGAWVKHGQPATPQPTGGCQVSQPDNQPQAKGDLVVRAPLLNEVIASPVTIKGQARGNWFFEAVMPIKLVTEAGVELGSCQGRAESDWQTTDLVPFSCQLSFVNPSEGRGFLIISQDNPSGDPAKGESYKYPISFGVTKTNVQVYWLQTSDQTDCASGQLVQRQAEPTTAVAKAAITELLAGPTAEEKARGLSTAINPDTKLQQLTIADGVAMADFSPELDKNSGGSCRVTAIRTQIEQTLKQFSTVRKVIISINGRSADILQP